MASIFTMSRRYWRRAFDHAGSFGELDAPSGSRRRRGRGPARSGDQPAEMPPDARPCDLTHVSPEHAHWPLVIMTVLTQMSVGAFGPAPLASRERVRSAHAASSPR